MKKRSFVVGAFVLTLVLLPLTGKAISGWGCWNCVWDGNGVAGPSEFFCEHVGHGANGENIYCEDVNSMGQNFCNAYGGACNYTVVCG